MFETSVPSTTADEIPEDRYNVEYVCLENRKKIYVMLNHRTAYLCWMNALKRGFLKQGAFLFHIDCHPDFMLHEFSLIDDNEKIADNQEKKLKDFVRTQLNILNYEFIVLAMYRGVIGDAISIDKQRDHDKIYGKPAKTTYSTTERNEFTDRKGKLHSFYIGGSSIRELFGYQGLLNDRFTHLDVQEAFMENVRNENMILDIDLDYFTYADDGRWALNERNLNKILDSEDFQNLLHCTKVITVALEPFFCGSTTECRYILKSLGSSLRKYLNVDIESAALNEFQKELVE